MKPHKTTYLVETYPRIVDMSIFGSSVEKTQWEKLKKIIIKISGRGDIPDFSTFRGGVYPYGLKEHSQQKEQGWAKIETEQKVSYYYQ